MTLLLQTFCKHKVHPIFYEIKYVDCNIKLGFLFFKICIVHLYIVFHVSLFLRESLDPLSFFPSSKSTKFRTWLIHEVHGFKSFLQK